MLGSLYASPVVEAPPASREQRPQLSEDLRRDTAVLQVPASEAPGGDVSVYILGASHVSRASCGRVAELIAAVRPDVVLVELCKDRLGLLVEPVQRRRGAQLWHTRRVTLKGLPEAPGWPGAERLLALLRTAPGRPVAMQDVEADCVTLLETGLFRRVAPTTRLPRFNESPQFLRSKGGHLTPIAPLGEIEFMVRERELPPIMGFRVRLDSSLPGATLPQPELDALCDELLAAAAAPSRTSASVYLEFLPRLRDLAAAHINSPAGLEVGYRGVESGQVEVVIKAASVDVAPPRAFVSGLEASAPGGVGPGIERFRPRRGKLEISKNMVIENLACVLDLPPETLEAVAGTPAADAAADAAAARTAWRPWTVVEMEAGEREDDDSSWAARFAGWLTETYAARQTAAAEKCGVAPGEAWRAALAAADACGAAQVHLGDMPASRSARRLANGVWRATLPRLAAFGAFAAAAVAASVLHALPEGVGPAVGGAVTAAAAAAVWPIAWPLAEVSLLAAKSGEQIEADVQLKEPIQGGEGLLRIWGEDAIIGFPGAQASIIDERDAYMARTIRAAAQGAAAAPAFVADSAAGRRVWRLLMPEGGSAAACPPGTGEGEFEPLGKPCTVVAVVGTAHVRGIIREWEAASSDWNARLDGLLADEIRAA
ncbi:hypothetical protein WJX81_002082 [Elliptochloris bilobata]|uniref:TraB domain-containing protein n=1 Tax=Elliptochloris bilobata TaxID=381761 RepID=A0AAW1RTM2_9CHLO